MPPYPQRGWEAACVVRKLLSHILDVVEVNLVHHYENNCVPFFLHLFRDGDLHLGKGDCHRWALYNCYLDLAINAKDIA